jgi:hypothetical protein
VVKTKFDQIVKLKKLDVEKIERELLKQNQKIEKANQELTQFKIEFSKFEYPKTGNFALITQFKTMQTAFLREIKQKEEELVFLENQKILLQGQLKDKQLEYEKIKYLQGEEIKKMVKKLKKEEAKNIDEIALMLFKRGEK